MYRRSLVPSLWILACLSFGAARAKTVYVNQNASGSPVDGTSWPTAYTTVTGGVNRAVAGDEVWVAAGLYVERITLKASVRIYGGFAGSETTRDQRNWTQNETVLQSPDTGTVVIAPASAARTAVFDGFTVTGVNKVSSGGIYCQPSASPTLSHNEITGNSNGILCFSGSAPLISGNTIHDNPQHNVYTNAGQPTISGNTFGYGDNYAYGGGVLTITGNKFDGSSGYTYGAVVDSGSSATLSKNTFTGQYFAVSTLTGGTARLDSNTFLGGDASDYGSGSTVVYGDHATVTFTNNTIVGVTGRIVQTTSGQLTATGNTIRHCTTYGNAIIDTQGTNATIYRNVLSQNLGSSYGGIGCVGGTTVSIRDNVVSLNTASSQGGGIAVLGPMSSCTVANNTLFGNRAVAGGNLAISGVTATVANNLILYGSSGLSMTGGSVRLSHNCVYGNVAYDYAGVADPTGTSGNLRANPRLANYLAGDVHIQPQSPCRDAGDNSVLITGELDMDGQKRVNGATVDIGADESDLKLHLSTIPIFRVKPDGLDSNDGSSWGQAMQTVMAAVNAADLAGGEVWVAGGTYRGNVQSGAFTYLYGGFNGTESSRDQRDWLAHPTVLDGSGGGSTVKIGGGSTFCTVDGFVINGGSGSPTIHGQNGGGGILCYASSPLIRHNTITGNSAPYGGGIFTDTYSEPIIEDNVISANSAQVGAGVALLYASPRLHRNVISRNRADSEAGGVFTISSAALVEQNTIVGNTAPYGGGVETNHTSDHASNDPHQGTSPIFRDNLISGNTATYGGGLLCGYNAALLSNNTVVSNSAPNGGGVLLFYNSAPTLANDIVAFNSSGIGTMSGTSGTASFLNNCIFANSAYEFSGIPSAIGKNGNFAADPGFIDRPYGNYHLAAVSPCIDTGDNSVVAVGEVDLDGLARIVGKSVDLGAYEYHTVGSPIGIGPAEALSVGGGLAGASILNDTMRAVSPIDIVSAVRIVRTAAGLDAGN